MSEPRRPFVVDAENLPPMPAPDACAPDPFAPPEGRTMRRVAALAAPRKAGWFKRITWSALVALVTLLAGVAAYNAVARLIASSPLLGNVAAGLAVIVSLGLLVFILREVIGLARLRRVDRLRQQVEAAARADSRASALDCLQAIARLYAGRAELAWARQNLSARLPDAMDASALLGLSEQLLLAPLDAQARGEVELAARQVAAATAIIPLPLIDVLAALAVNLRMLRRVAMVYGGRTGTLGSWRLMRAVAAHLLATGAVAMGDDLFGSVLGGGAIGKVSRRLGEGVVNGALTARVGIAAMDVCRPMPFVALKRPRVTTLVKRALTGLFS